MNMTIGIIGVGHLASYIVEGLMSTKNPPRIILSPRGASNAARLSTRYGLPIADNNDDVVTRSDAIILATRPNDLLETCTGLPWEVGQTAISVAAGVTLSSLEQVVSPATAVRTLPVTAAKICESPTCLFPENAVARRIFEDVGSVHVFDDEETYDLASIQGVIFSVFHAGIQSIAGWMEETGLDKDTARELAARALRATGGMVLAHPENDFDHMVAEYATEGTLTLAALEELRKNGGLSGWPDALTAALERNRQVAKDTQ